MNSDTSTYEVTKPSELNEMSGTASAVAVILPELVSQLSSALGRDLAGFSWSNSTLVVQFCDASCDYLPGRDVSDSLH